MSVQPEELLGHADFIRQIARRLICDQDLIADITQDTMVAALESPPKEDRPMRAWLGSVAKNLTCNIIRRENRRVRREWVAAKPAHVPSTAEIVELEETRRKVVDAVLSLKSPYRSVVLLRFYKDLPPRKIAEILDLPVETVKTRLKRGLETLRQGLDAAHNGDRKEWCLALAPVAGLEWSKAAVGSVGLSLLTAQAKPLLLALALFAAVTVPMLFFKTESPRPQSVATAPTEIETAPVSRETGFLGPVNRDAMSQDGMETGAKNEEMLCGRALDVRGDPVPDAEIMAVRVKTLTEDLTMDAFSAFRTRTDERGYFTLTELLPGEYGLIASKDDRAGHRSAFAASEKSHPSGSFREYEIVLKPCRSVSGRITDGDGRPLAGVYMAAYAPWPGYEPASFARTDGSGRFILNHLTEGRCHVLAAVEGKAPLILSDLDTWRKDLDLVMGPGRFIEGKVTFQQKPVCGAEVSITCAQTFMVPLKVKTQTDGEGKYRLGPLPIHPDIRLTPVEIRATDRALQTRTVLRALEGTLKTVDLAMTETGAAAGRVVDAGTGDPLSGVWVTACAESEGGTRVRRYDIRTGPDGAFLFASMAPDLYLFCTHTQGTYASAWAEKGFFFIPEGQRMNGIEFQLKQGISLHVGVRGENDLPVEGAELSVRNADPAHLHGRLEEKIHLLSHVRDLGDGNYRVDGLQPGLYEIGARKQGWFGDTGTLTLHDASRDPRIELTLRPAFPLSGQVVDPRGRAVAGASVFFGNGRSTFADSRGAFQVYDMVSREDDWVKVTAPGFLEFYKTQTFTGESEPLSLTVEPLGPLSLEGTVTDEKGTPVENVLVSMEQIRGKQSIPAHCSRLKTEQLTGKDGRFHFHGLIDRPVNLTTRAQGYFVTNSYAGIPANTKDLRITVSRYARVAGRVLDREGNPVTGFRLFTVEEGEKRFLKELRGPEFDVDVRPGRIVLLATTPQGMQARSVPITLEPGKRFDRLTLRTGPGCAVPGCVLDGIARTPVAGASVSLLAEDLETVCATVASDETGAFHFEGVLPGHYRMAVKHDDYCPARTKGFRVHEGTACSEVPVLLFRGCSVTGRVCRGAEGLSGVNVIAVPGPAGWERGAVSGTDGLYRIDRLPDGAGEIRAVFPDKGSDLSVTWFQSLKKGENNCDFQLGRGSIEGKVSAPREGEGDWTVEALMTIRGPVDADSDCLYRAQARIGEDGRYRIGNLPPGRYTVMAWWENRGRRHRVCKETHVMDQEVILDFEIGEGLYGEVHGVVRDGERVLAEVEVTLKGNDPYFWVNTETDEFGCFSFGTIPSGRLVLTAVDHRSGFGMSRSIDLGAGQVLRQNMVWKRGTGVLSGRIESSGDPRDDIPVKAVRYSEDSGESIFASTVTEEGQYRFEDLLPGRYHVRAEMPWYYIDKIAEVASDRAARVDFSANPGDSEIRGRVVDRELSPLDDLPSFDGNITVFVFKKPFNPLKPGQAYVPLSLVDGLLREQVVYPREGNTFHFTGLPAGDYEVVAARILKGYVREAMSQTVSLEEGESLLTALRLSQ